MELEQIVTLASKRTELQFRAMERSLRATGSHLPVAVIPYDESRFCLPNGSTWWTDPEILSWLAKHARHPMMRKYSCLTLARYQYVDTDCIFLRDPAEALATQSDFVVCCGHWRDPAHTVTSQSRLIMQQRSTNWQAATFNAGQFACDRVLWSAVYLKKVASDDRYRSTILDFLFHDQPGLNLLVHLSGVTINNLTLPPIKLESSWAGDYRDAGWREYWKAAAVTPYMIHWAGLEIDGSRPIDELYLEYLSSAERETFVDTRRKNIPRYGLSFPWRQIRKQLRKG